MSAASIERGLEWPCEHCSDLGSTAGYFDPGSGAAEPPEAFCASECCPVDAEQLRELEDAVELAAEYMGKAMVASERHAKALLEETADRLAEVFENTFGEARVPFSAIRQRLILAAGAHFDRQRKAAA